MSGARIELWRSRSYWRDEKITSRHLGADGRYSIPVKASDNFDLYVKVLLHDDDGVELENWYSPFTWETTTSNKRSRSGTVDLGTWQIGKDGSGTPKCAIWQGVHNAYGNYRQIIGSRPPSNIKIEAEFPCCGTPFTTTNTIRWPGGYAVRANYSVPFHEFAHSVRHSLDGNFGHFLLDAARYQYPQTHTSCKVTNQGFAFNEGWAEYWAGDYSTCSPRHQLQPGGQRGGRAGPARALLQPPGHGPGAAREPRADPLASATSRARFNQHPGRLRAAADHQPPGRASRCSPPSSRSPISSARSPRSASSWPR